MFDTYSAGCALLASNTSAETSKRTEAAVVFPAMVSAAEYYEAVQINARLRCGAYLYNSETYKLDTGTS